jgi:hypothetical protein
LSSERLAAEGRWTPGRLGGVRGNAIIGALGGAAAGVPDGGAGHKKRPVRTGLPLGGRIGSIANWEGNYRSDIFNIGALPGDLSAI